MKYIGTILTILGVMLLGVAMQDAQPSQASSCASGGFRKSAGAPPYSTGAPVERLTCAQATCHDGFTGLPNIGFAITELDLGGASNGYQPGQTYTLTVSMQRPEMKRMGFQITHLQDNDITKSPGSITITDTGRTQLRDNATVNWGCCWQDRKWVGHKYNGIDPDPTGYIEWSWEWTAPPTNVGSITFYLATLEANEDLVDTFDFVYTLQKTIPACTGFTAEPGGSKLICLGDSVRLGGNPSVIGCNGPFAYNWSPANGLSCTDCPNPMAAPGVDQTYTLQVTDNLGNTDSRTVEVSINLDGAVGNWSLDDGNGIAATDSSGNGRMAELVNGPVWVQGIKGMALEFDGNDDYLEVPDFNTPNSFSIEAWIKTYGATGAAQLIVSKHNREYDIRIDDDGGLYARSGESTLKDVTTDIEDSFFKNQWQQIVYVRDGANRKHHLYRNGEKVATGIHNTVVENTNTKFRIGRHSQFDFGTFNGIIDEVNFYSCVLDEAAVAAMYSAMVDTMPNQVRTGAMEPTITAYPNPAGEMLYFKGVGNWTTPHAQVIIYNTQGHVVQQATMTAKMGTAISLARLPAGLYVYTFRTSNGIARSKFIKQ